MQERHIELRIGRDPPPSEGIGCDDPADLSVGAQDDRDESPHESLDAGFDTSGEFLIVAFAAFEDGIAALEKGVDVSKSLSLRQRAERFHLEPIAAAHIDPAEKRDVTHVDSA